MSIGVKSIIGSEICIKLAKDIKKTPLIKGEGRSVAVVRDGFTKMMGKNDDSMFVSLTRKDGYSKLIRKSLKNNTAVKIVNYPDGSFSETAYAGMRPLGTAGKFMISDKNNAKVGIEYSTRGYFSPQAAKKDYEEMVKSINQPKNIFAKAFEKIKDWTGGFLDLFGKKHKS